MRSLAYGKQYYTPVYLIYLNVQLVTVILILDKEMLSNSNLRQTPKVSVNIISSENECRKHHKSICSTCR